MAKGNTSKKYKIIIPTDIKPQPNIYEIKTAQLMSIYLNDDITFIKRKTSTTPDILAVKHNQTWEIKNIRGNNKNTINRNLKGVYRQSERVIITLFRTKMKPNAAKNYALRKLSRGSHIKRLIIATKDEKIIVIK